MNNELYGQWYINDLMREFYKEGQCYKMIDGFHANIFRGYA